MKRNRDYELLIPFYRNERIVASITLVVFVRIVLALALVAVLAFTYVLWDLNRLSASNHQVRVAVCGIIKAHDDELKRKISPEFAALVDMYDCNNV